MLPKMDKSTSNTNPNSFSKNLTNVDSTIKCSSSSSCDASNTIETCAFINPREFSQLILDKHQTISVVDCRSQIDFGCERIRSSYNVNCRAKLMVKKLSTKRLEDIESNLSVSLTNSDAVILYDQLTDVREEEKLRSLPINLVVQSARRSNKKVYVIQGGFDAVKTECPHLIESTSETSKEKCEQDYAPPSPDTIDKENFTMSEILPHIFVGNILDAQNMDRLKQNGITHIINSTPDLPLFWEEHYQYLRVDVLDLPSQNIRKYFDAAFQFIEDALHTKTNNILVHCSAGISRSPTIVLAFMMKKHQMKFDDAFHEMRQLRRIVDPNFSFILQLRDWETKCLSNNENHDEKTCNHSRATSNTYCGSSSKSKTDTKSHTDSAIVVN